MGQRYVRRLVQLRPLQWGRDLTDADGASIRTSLRTTASFNGAGDLTDADGTCPGYEYEAEGDCFNGAAT